MKNILFVEPNSRALEPLSTALAGAWNSRLAANSPEALDLLDQQPADVVVASLLLPGMNGAQFLQEVSRRHPRAIRIALTGDSDREQALQRSAFCHQVLSRTCNPSDLETALARALLLRDILTNDRLQHVIKQLRSLPSLPSLYLQLMDELRSEEPAIDRIGEIVSHDVAMSAKLLQVVNSAYIGLGARVTSPADAVIYLGIEAVKGLLLSLQIFSHFDKVHFDSTEFSQDALWRHCWTTGVRCRLIARTETGDPGFVDNSFVGGLLHDVGKLVLASELPEAYQKVLFRARQKQIHVAQAEQEILGCTHAEIGAFLLNRWNLPDEVVEAVALHHRPGDSIHPGFSPLTAVHVGNALDHKLHTAFFSAEDSRLDSAYLEAAGVAEKLEDWWIRCLKAGSRRERN